MADCVFVSYNIYSLSIFECFIFDLMYFHHLPHIQGAVDQTKLFGSGTTRAVEGVVG